MAYRIERMEEGDSVESYVYLDSDTVPIGIGRARVVGEEMVLDSLFATPGQGIGSVVFLDLELTARSKKLRRIIGTLATFPEEEENTRRFYRRMGVDVALNGKLHKKLR